MFSKKTICFVTGASRGLGKSIVINFAHKLPAGSMLVLLARNKSDLERVKLRLLQESPHVTALTHVFDQSTQNQCDFEAVFSEAFKSTGATVSDFEQAIFIHNAATLKPMKYVRNLPGVDELNRYWTTNLSGVLALTTEFLKVFPTSSKARRIVVNISSLAGVKPHKSWAMYCSGKAARDMMFKVLAAEEEDVCVLNYAPGPLDTDMTVELSQDAEDESLRNWGIGVIKEKKLLTCDASSAKLIEILEKNTFESGAHIDYYDEI